MCINMKRMYICKHPKKIYGNFILKTRQYNEYVQYEKEYALFENNPMIIRFNDVERVYIPCGKCLQCLTKRSKAWTLRLTTEYIKYRNNCVLTLTYDNEHLPEDGLINYRDVQLFLKRLRKKLGKDHKIKFACCSEYGSLKLRPHYHIIIFNWFPSDVDLRYPYKVTKKRSKLYKSKICNNLWSNGFVDVGLVDYHTARYVTQYCVKKCIHKDFEGYKEKNKLKREKLVCSVGTGYDYFIQNFKTIFNSCFCQLGGLAYPIPKYFKNKCKEMFPEIYDNYKCIIRDRLKDFILDDKQQKKFDAIEARLRGVYDIFHSKLTNDHLTSVLT